MNSAGMLKTVNVFPSMHSPKISNLHLSLHYKLLYSNQGNIAPSRIASLSIELSEMEPAIQAIHELEQKRASIAELDEVY